jgi:hypothetical protein
LDTSTRPIHPEMIGHEDQRKNPSKILSEILLDVEKPQTEPEIYKTSPVGLGQTQSKHEGRTEIGKTPCDLTENQVTSQKTAKNHNDEDRQGWSVLYHIS